jgi:hypothetical protein
MKNETKTLGKLGKGGRPPKNDRATHRLTVNLNDAEYARFLSMYEQSGVSTQARFVVARIFGEPFKAVKTDASALAFTAKLTELNAQIRRIGVNYNQHVKQLHTTFGERKVLSLLYKLEQETIDLSKFGLEALKLCEQFKEKFCN